MIISEKFCFELYEKATNSLCRGRLSNAQFLFLEAAKNYLGLCYKIENMKSEDIFSICKLNAAICYYLGHNYADCLKTLDSIKKSRLRPELQEKMTDLYEEAIKKRRQGYWETIALDLAELKSVKRHKDIIELVKNNPFILSDREFLEQMITSCKELEMPEVAQSFENNLKELKDYD